MNMGNVFSLHSSIGPRAFVPGFGTSNAWHPSKQWCWTLSPSHVAWWRFNGAKGSTHEAFLLGGWRGVMVKYGEHVSADFVGWPDSCICPSSESLYGLPESFPRIWITTFWLWICLCTSYSMINTVVWHIKIASTPISCLSFPNIFHLPTSFLVKRVTIPIETKLKWPESLIARELTSVST